MIYATIKKIFQQARYDKLFTSEQLKVEVHKRTGHYPAPNEFQREFLRFRDETKLPILKIYMMSRWLYTKSIKESYVRMHNGALTRLQKKNEERKKSKKDLIV